MIPAGDPHFLLSPAVQDGRQQQEPALHPRGHQLDLPQRRDRLVPPPDLPQGFDRKDGVVADPGPGYVVRWDYLKFNHSKPETVLPSSAPTATSS